MIRIFAAHGQLIHDPASGTTHHSPQPLPDGRTEWDDAIVARWPEAAPADFHRTTPSSVCWSPIVRCNLHCPQCLDDTQVPELAAPQRRRIARVLASADVLAVDISGGEPLLLRELPELARIIRDGGRAVSITTNGWHLARRARELADHVDAVRVSLDGSDAARHDTIRGVGSFTRAIEGIRAARHGGLPVQIQTVLMRRTAADLQDMADLAHTLGATGLSVLQMLPIGAGASLANERLSDHAATNLVNALHMPNGLRVRLRTRDAAGNFTVIRADGRVWRNSLDALHIAGVRPLRDPDDLILSSRDGTA